MGSRKSKPNSPRNVRRPTMPIERVPLLAASTIRALSTDHARRGLVAVFDVDGTIASIARRPHLVSIPASVKRSLRALARRGDTTVGFVSGRLLRDVAAIVGAGPWSLAGIHGNERLTSSGKFARTWSAAEEVRAHRLASRLERVFTTLPGVWIEKKGPILAVHVREAAPDDVAAAVRAARAMLPAGFEIMSGKSIIELRPKSSAHKGDAVRWIAAERPGAPILYIGDDTTDEDAFASLGPRDFPVLVADAAHLRERAVSGRATTNARWRLRSPRDVGRLIARLAVDPTSTT